MPASNSPIQPTSPVPSSDWSGDRDTRTIAVEGHSSPAYRIVQGKPVARRGRKARDLSSETARLPVLPASTPSMKKEQLVKANLARFTWALTLLASMALTVGAGIRWD